MSVFRYTLLSPPGYVYTTVLKIYLPSISIWLAFCWFCGFWYYCSLSKSSDFEGFSWFCWIWSKIFGLTLLWSGRYPGFSFLTLLVLISWEYSYIKLWDFLGKKCRCIGSLFWRRSSPMSIWARYFYPLVSYLQNIELKVRVLGKELVS